MSFTLSREPLRILLTGATGLIGGAVLQRFLAHPKSASFALASYSRDAERATKLAVQFRVTSVLGTLDEGQKLEDAAAAADVVLHFALSSDHLPSARAILRGLKRRHADTGRVPIYIHTSGSLEFVDEARGLYRKNVSYDDADVDQLKAIREDAIHRHVDLEVVAADLEGYVRTYIVFPGFVFGLSSGPLVSAGLAREQSQLISWFVQASIARGRTGAFGEGSNLWSWVHVEDVADLYILLFDALLDDPQRVGHGWDGFYFGVAGQVRALEIAKSVERNLVHLGKIEATEGALAPWTKEEVGKYFHGFDTIGANCTMVATRARALGWEPKYTNEDCEVIVLADVQHVFGDM